VIHDEEKFWDRKTKPLSPGNGNWKKTLEHLFLNIYNFVKNEQELRELFGWKKFGRVTLFISLSFIKHSFLFQRLKQLV
jgi:hypothetical protein